MNRLAAVCAAATLMVLSVAGSSDAQSDHLKCYKLKDIAQFKSATADLVPSNPSFVGENCTIKGKGAQICVPVDKDNVAVEEGTDQDFPTQNLTNAVLCYKVKCPDATSASIQVSDQFGTRTITKGKASKVCGPAIEQ
jgi:hypothetical protein